MTTRNSNLALIGILGSLLPIVAFVWIGREFADSYELELSGFNLPAPNDAYFLLLWMFFGGIASILFAFALFHACKLDAVAKVVHAAERISERNWILLCAIAGALIPIAVHLLILHGAWVTDDEEAYKFSARLLAQGKLYIGSYPEKEFFDRQFLVNDGRMYSQYFLGWPALMIPGVWLRQEWLINPILSALTVFPVFQVVKHYSSSSCARLMTILFVLSPMLAIGAATLHSHTSCLLFLWAALYSFVEWEKQRRGLWLMAITFCFSVAFFIRPTSALGIGLPILAFAVLSSIGNTNRETVSRFFLLSVPCLLLGATFLLINDQQNGSYIRTAYQAYDDWKWDDQRLFQTEAMHPEKSISFQTSSMDRGLATSGVALLRINFALFGWPAALIFVWFALLLKRNWLISLMIPSYVAIHWLVENVGVGVYAPMHFIEISVPLMILTAVGINAISRLAGKSSDPNVVALGRLPYVYAYGSSILAALVYMPITLLSVERLASDISLPNRYAKSIGITNALVFSPTPFTRNCTSWPAKASAYFMPINGPELNDDILWVNHVTYLRDVRFAAQFPRRAAYAMSWTPQCELKFVPLQSAEASALPDNPVVRSKFLRPMP